jgi:hypothetical protein
VTLVRALVVARGRSSTPDVSTDVALVAMEIEGGQVLGAGHGALRACSGSTPRCARFAPVRRSIDAEKC